MLDIFEMIAYRFKRPMRFSISELDHDLVCVILDKNGVDLAMISRIEKDYGPDWIRFDFEVSARKLKRIRRDLDKYVTVQRWYAI